MKENCHHKKRVSKRKINLYSLELCAGGGGTALGLEEAGFTPVALIDNDNHACATLRINRPYWNVIEADIQNIDSKYWRGIDLLSGGLPCPPFSIAGKQLGAEDERNMFPAMLRIVKDINPRAVLIENVRGLLSSRFKPFRENLTKSFDALGFECYWEGLNAVDFGVPQMRFRTFMVALKRGKTKTIVWPTYKCSKYQTVSESINDLISERGWRGAAAWRKRATSPAPTIVGGSHKHGGPDLGPTRARQQWANLGIDGIALANEAPDRDFKGMPRLTIPMVARLQCFPDSWKFAGTKTQVYRQVGNALPSRFANEIGKAVRKCLE